MVIADTSQILYDLLPWQSLLYFPVLLQKSDALIFLEEVESFLVQMSEKEAILQAAIEELTKNEAIIDNPGYQEASDKLNSLIEEIQKEKEDAESKKKDFTSDFENQQEDI